MADRPKDQPSISNRLVGHDTIEIEFLIDDLVKQLATDRLRSVAACNGCNSCKASAELPRPDQPRPRGGRQ